MFHITISSCEDPDLFELLEALSGRHRAAKARALMRRGLHGPVGVASNTAPPMPPGEQPGYHPLGSPPAGDLAVEDVDSLDFNIDELMRNLAKSRLEE